MPCYESFAVITQLPMQYTSASFYVRKWWTT